jgi:peptidyl-prolyl cis-trans isomerase A (cyclophilin A)
MNRTKALLPLLVVLLIAIGGAGCGSSEESEGAAVSMGEDGPLLNPDHEEFKTQAPAEFKVKFETSAGDFTIDVVRAWTPHGVDRFYNLVRLGFYDECRFFRVVPGFVAQFGMSGTPEIQQIWGDTGMPDDAVKQGNKAGYITYAKSGAPNSRSTQLFINLTDNSRLDGMGFAAFGRVSEGMEVVNNLYAGYGDGPPSGTGPNQGQIMTEGNEYLKAKFASLDYIKKASILP